MNIPKMKNITKDIEIMQNSLGWDKKGVFFLVYLPYKALSIAGVRKIGKVYISKEITFTDPDIVSFMNENEGSMEIFEK